MNLYLILEQEMMDLLFFCAHSLGGRKLRIFNCMMILGRKERGCMKAKVYPEKTWEAIREEYITTDSGYTALAKLHGVPFTQIRNRSIEEGWPEKKEAYKKERIKQAIEDAKKFQQNENDRTFRIASKLLDKIEQSVESLIPEDRDGIKKLTSAIMDLKNIGIFRADLDREEQMARIAKLRKDAEDEVVDKNIVITFAEGFDEYAN